MSDSDSGEKLGSNLTQLVQQLEKIEFKTDRDLYQYARILRALGLELHMRVAMDADVIGAILAQYKGKWWTFGAQSKIRSKLVAAHLKGGASAAKVLGLSGVKMYASFVKHFIQPEIEAERKAREGKGKKKPGFSIGDKPKGAAGKPGESGKAA
jgi:superfamily I DNA and RNA helicase